MWNYLLYFTVTIDNIQNAIYTKRGVIEGGI